MGAMHPLVPAVTGGVVGAVAYLVVSGGIKETYERIAFVVGCVCIIGAGFRFVYAGVPAVDVKRGLAVGAVGLSTFLLGVNGAVGFQAGSGGFSSVRTNAMIGMAVFAIILALCLPYVRPAA